MYRERTASVPGAVLWQRDTLAGSTTRILPDGCLDLIWDGSRLLVAGPDIRARLHQAAAPSSLTALRFAGGLGPGLFGLPAVHVRDRTVPLEDLWPAAPARELAERVAGDPVAALDAWLPAQVARSDVDPLGGRVVAMARAGLTVREIADHAGLGQRRLHRRCLELFGYGPRHLGRVMRLERALALAREGVPLARVAVDSGYADQPHLAREVRDLTGVTAGELLGRGRQAHVRRSLR